MINNLKQKRILITGITGFIGSALAKRLEKEGAQVFGISRTIKKGNIYSVDCKDFASISTFIKKHKIQLCFHLAGEALVESGQQFPYETFMANTQTTLNLLECARIYHIERIIIASTSHVYGKNIVPYKEYYTPKPSRPYETSKACTDLIAQSYADTYNLPVMIARFVNVYGPGDMHFTRLIPKTITSVLAGINPQMWGGDALREYLYLDDAIDAYIKMAKVSLDKIHRNRIFNIGSGHPYSVYEVIEKIVAISKKNVSIDRIKDEREFEIKAQFVSSAKAKRLLGWRSKTTLEEGLKKTIRWYSKNR